MSNIAELTFSIVQRSVQEYIMLCSVWYQAYKVSRVEFSVSCSMTLPNYHRDYYVLAVLNSAFLAQRHCQIILEIIMFSSCWIQRFLFKDIAGLARRLICFPDRLHRTITAGKIAHTFSCHDRPYQDHHLRRTFLTNADERYFSEPSIVVLSNARKHAVGTPSCTTPMFWKQLSQNVRKKIHQTACRSLPAPFCCVFFDVSS